ncbi:capsid and scaffold protein [Kochikohdavirus PBEF19]|uniref:Capsid and scaffold protein n=1 Tax=Enterococcus phage PBEF129 TaxID=2696337 RepID=A0A6B9SRE1_9CAUD|nr:capsid and scaffold protein [Enterococcus phage PBEF129]
MALNGTKYTAFARHRLVLEWRANQNIAGNYSTISVWLYLQSMDKWGRLDAPAIGDAKVTVEGATQTEKASSMLNAFQKKLLLAKEWRVNHNNDGSKRITIGGSYFVNVTFTDNGVPTYYGTITIPNFSVDLNRIPRRSSLNPVPTLNLPGNLPITINRQSSTFKHNLTAWVANRDNPTLSNDAHWTYLTNLNNVDTSGSFSFTVANNKTIFTALNNRTSWQGKVKLWTIGLDDVVSQERTYKIVPPMNAQASGGKITLNVGEKINVSLSNYRSDANFTYDGVFNISGLNIPIATNSAGNTMSYTLTQTDVDNILKKIPNADSSWGQVTVTSKYSGVQYRTPWTGQRIDITIPKNKYVPSINGTPTYEDTSSVSVGLTGDNQVALQGKSNIKVTIPANFATANGYSTLKTIDVSLGGTSKTVNYSNAETVVELGAPANHTSDTLIVTVTDSRGFKSNWTKHVDIYPYENPNMYFTVTRRNNFETTTDINVNSTWSPITIGGVNKNAIQSVTYATKVAGVGTYGEETALNFTANGSMVTVKNTPIELDNTNTYDVRLSITDKFSTFTRTATVKPGNPIMFIDADNRSLFLGNAFVDNNNNELRGLLEIERDKWQDRGLVGISLNNSDISAVNGIWFSTDTSDNAGEGLHFIKSGKSRNSLTWDDYDYFYMRDNGFYVNHNTNPIFEVSDTGTMTFPTKQLWKGVVYLNDIQEILPSKKLTECRNGWVLTFSAYESGAGRPWDINQVYIHKSVLNQFNTRGFRAMIGHGTTITFKYMYITDGRIGGHAGNGIGVNSGIAIREVSEW